MNKKIWIALTGAFAGIIACCGDFFSMFISGKKYPGYSQLRDLISLLGNSDSPVSGSISGWWIFMGLLFILFAIGFFITFRDEGKLVKLATWLIILYGVGEGIGSGLFKADSIDGSMTLSYMIHDLVGSVGIFAIIILPLVVLKIPEVSASNGFRLYSKIVVVLGVLFWIIFSFRFLGNKDNPFGDFMGLWQRLFLVDYYFYLIVIAGMMIKKTLKITEVNT